jgi:hypothetical protein
MGSRVELYAAIRFDWQRNQMSIRALAEKYSVHRRTVREAVESPIPPPRKSPPRCTLVLDTVRESVDAMLAEDLTAPRKQRHTAKRIYERLRAEHDAAVSYSYVAKYVNRRRREIAAAAAARAGVVAGFVPQQHLPGAEAEVDFADLWVRLAGEMTKCFLFTLRLSCSGRAVHRVFASQGQEAFLEGHVAAFEILGGYVGVGSRFAAPRGSTWRCSSSGSADALDAVLGSSSGPGWSRPGQSRRPAGRRLPGVRGRSVPREHRARDGLRPEGVLLGRR